MEKRSLILCCSPCFRKPIDSADFPEIEDLSLPSENRKKLPKNRPIRGIMAKSKHVDIEQLMEDYGWRHFVDVQATKATRHSEYRNIERDDIEFEVNLKKLRVSHDEPNYTNLHPTSAKPYTLFKSHFTNNTDRDQAYSFKTERTTESMVCVAREQGYSMGTEIELSLKTPAEIMEAKAGFKHELNFNEYNENSIVEQLTWGVDSTVNVPARYHTIASIIIEEMKYQGTYVSISRIAGPITVVLRRRRDGVLIVPITVSVAEVFRELLESGRASKDLKAIASVEEGNVVKLVSKGNCSFQFAMKQKIDLSESPLSDRDVMTIE